MFEQSLDRAQALWNAFRIVDAIHPQPDVGGFDSLVAKQRGPFRCRESRHRFSAGVAVEGDADRKWPHRGRMLFAVDREMLAIDARLQGLVDGLQEIVAVRLDVESDQVGGQHAIQQFALPRADAKGLGIGPWDVPKYCDTSIGSFLFHHARKQGEVIVLDEDKRVAGAVDLLEQCRREFTVDAAIVVPVAGAKDGARVCDMAERPESFVREAEIEPLFLLAAQPHSAQRILRMVREAPASRPCSSAVLRSASPVACATHVPSQTRSTGSSAVTKPLGGTDQINELPK